MALKGLKEKYNLKANQPLTQRGIEALVFISFSILVGWHYFISDSEFWAITISKELWSTDTSHSSVFYKPIFNAITSIPFAFDLSNTTHLLATKFIFALIGSALLLAWHTVFRLHASSTAAIAATLWLLTDQLFFTNFFRVRSDILASLCSALAILSLRMGRSHLKPESPVRLGLFTLTLLCVLGSTPKAIYHFVLVGIYTLLIFRKQVSPTYFRRILIAYFAAPAAGLILLSIALGSPNNVFKVFAEAAIYHLNSSSGGLWPINSSTFRYWAQDLIRQPFHWLLLALLIAVTRPKVAWLTATTFVLILIHNQRLPFFIASLMPFMAMSIASSLKSIRQKHATYFFAGLALLFTIEFTFWFKPRDWYSSSTNQLEAITKIESILSQFPNSTLFDGQGILPRGPLTYHFFSPGDHQSNSTGLDTIRSHNPLLILQTPRFNYTNVIWQSELPKLGYREIEWGLWIKNYPAAESIKPFGILWPSLFGYENPLVHP